MHSTQIFVHRDEPSPEAIDPISNWEPHKTVDDTSIHNKPAGGIWSSPAASDWGWLDWAESNDWYWGDETVWSLQPDESATVYTIDSREDLEWLHEQYGWIPDIIAYESILDFEAIFDDYDALYLTKEGQEKTRHGQPNLYGWDCSSVLWNSWHFEHVEKLGTIDDFM